MEKPVFKLAPPGHEQPFDLTALDLCVPGIPDGVLLAQCGLCVMAAPSPPRRFAAWRVEAPLFAVSLFGGPCKLRSIWLDAWPCTTQCLVIGKVLSTSAVARTTPCRASSIHRPVAWPADDIDMDCCRILPINSITCSQEGPMSL